MEVITEILVSKCLFFMLVVRTTCTISEQADRKVVYHGLLIKLVFKLFAFDKIMSYNL